MENLANTKQTSMSDAAKWRKSKNQCNQGVCAILIFNKYTYFWQFAYLSLLSMWKYTYFQPKWMKRQKLGNIVEIVCNLWSFLIFQWWKWVYDLIFLGQFFKELFPSSSQRTRLSLKYDIFQPKNMPKNTYFAQKDTY